VLTHSLKDGSNSLSRILSPNFRPESTRTGKGVSHSFHMQDRQEHSSQMRDSLREWATLLYNAAWYAWRRGNVGDAEKMSVKAMKTRTKLLGKEHEETLSGMGMVGIVYNVGGRWKEAEELEVQVMEMKKSLKRVLGTEHPDMLTSINNLALTYWEQGRWKEAKGLKVQVLETRKRVLGAEHPYTLTSIDNLASIYRNQDRWKRLKC
jgi:tetratricopeptide (TPR) repeat protein